VREECVKPRVRLHLAPKPNPFDWSFPPHTAADSAGRGFFAAPRVGVV